MMTQLAKFLAKYAPGLDKAGMAGLDLAKKAGTAGLEMAKKNPTATAGIGGALGGYGLSEALDEDEPTEEQVMEFLRRRGQIG